MMTKFINCYYRGIANVMVWCAKAAIKLAPTWRQKMEICDDMYLIVDDLFSTHWKEARAAGVKLFNVLIDVEYEFEKEFREMERIYRIYYGEETA